MRVAKHGEDEASHAVTYYAVVDQAAQKAFLDFAEARHRPHASASRAYRAYRTSDRRRPEIFLDRELGIARRNAEPAASACAPSRDPASERRGRDRCHRAAAAAHAAVVESSRVSTRRPTIPSWTRRKNERRQTIRCAARRPRCARSCRSASIKKPASAKRRRLCAAARRQAGEDAGARNALALPNARTRHCGRRRVECDRERTSIPSLLPLTRLANLAIDAIADAPQPVVDEIVQYAGTDLVFYRAGEPAGPWSPLQNERWNPVIDWAASKLGRALLARRRRRACDAQPMMRWLRCAKRRKHCRKPFALAAAASATNIAGSALIALALANGALSGDEAWNAAHVDEQWNISQWGEDDEAQRRLAARHAEFTAAAKMLDAACDRLALSRSAQDACRRSRSRISGRSRASGPCRYARARSAAIESARGVSRRDSPRRRARSAAAVRWRAL